MLVARRADERHAEVIALTLQALEDPLPDKAQAIASSCGVWFKTFKEFSSWLATKNASYNAMMEAEVYWNPGKADKVIDDLFPSGVINCSLNTLIKVMDNGKVDTSELATLKALTEMLKPRWKAASLPPHIATPSYLQMIKDIENPNQIRLSGQSLSGGNIPDAVTLFQTTSQVGAHMLGNSCAVLYFHPINDPMGIGYNVQVTVENYIAIVRFYTLLKQREHRRARTSYRAMNGSDYILVKHSREAMSVFEYALVKRGSCDLDQIKELRKQVS